MKPPKTPEDFDYDLWTTEAGLCMVRIKRTGEVCEVGRDTFRLLRAEEKRLRRSKAGIVTPNHPSERSALLSTDYISLDSSDNMQAGWLIDPMNMEDSLATLILEDDFMKTLSMRQRDVYIQCIVGDVQPAEYARLHNISKPRVSALLKEIREKAKKFFEGG